MAAERHAALRIFLWIAQLMDGQNALATSKTAISEALDLHRNTVTQAIAYLKEKKVMAILKQARLTYMFLIMRLFGKI